MLANCFRFAPRDSVPGLIAKICKYLKEHPGWSEEELEEQIKQYIANRYVESFNGRNGLVELNKGDVNNLKISTSYFAEGDETIDELDILSLYNQGVRFVFTNWNSLTSGYDLSYALEYFDGSNDVVYYPMSTGASGGNIVSVNGKTGIVNLSLSDILGDSGAQVKLCSATEFTSTTLVTWNAYYELGYRLVCVLNSEATAVDYLYVLKQDVNNHQPIMILSYDSRMLGGKLPSYYATSESVNQLLGLYNNLNLNKLDKTATAADSAKLGGLDASQYAKLSDIPGRKLKSVTLWSGNALEGDVITLDGGDISIADCVFTAVNIDSFSSPMTIPIYGESFTSYISAYYNGNSANFDIYTARLGNFNANYTQATVILSKRARLNSSANTPSIGNVYLTKVVGYYFGN